MARNFTPPVQRGFFIIRQTAQRGLPDYFHAGLFAAGLMVGADGAHDVGGLLASAKRVEDCGHILGHTDGDGFGGGAGTAGAGARSAPAGGGFF